MPNFKNALVSCVFLLTLVPVNLYAFHSVTEVLPSKKILICKDFNQVRSGRKIEVWKKKFSTSRSGQELVVAKEFELPEVGNKVELYHRETHRISKSTKLEHNEKIGSGTIVDFNLDGESIKRIKVGKTSNKKIEEVEDRLSPDEISKLNKDCLLIKPDSDIEVKNLTDVSL